MSCLNLRQPSGHGDFLKVPCTCKGLKCMYLGLLPEVGSQCGHRADSVHLSAPGEGCLEHGASTMILGRQLTPAHGTDDLVTLANPQDMTTTAFRQPRQPLPTVLQPCGYATQTRDTLFSLSLDHSALSGSILLPLRYSSVVG
jgi:hypothetical protein